MISFFQRFFPTSRHVIAISESQSGSSFSLGTSTFASGNNDDEASLTLLPQHYRIECKIASGTYSSVWKATDEETGITVAIKAMALYRDTASGDCEHNDAANQRSEQRLGRAKREDGLWKTVCNEYLLPRYASYACDPLRATVTQYCNGGDLFTHMERYYDKRGSFRLGDAKDTLHVMRSVLRALHYLHDTMHLVHRDVKPENILVHFDNRTGSNNDNSHRGDSNSDSDSDSNNDGDYDYDEDRVQDRTRLRDARIILGDFTFLTPFEGTRGLKDSLGTPDFVAPEIWRQEGYGAAVDCWSAGVTIYECFEGRHPFKRYEQHDSVYNSVLYNSMRPMLNVDSTAERVVCGLLRREPGVRYTAQQALRIMQWL